MTEYLTEQEQIEQLKKWFRTYGLPALFGILAGLVIFYGWNHYQNHRSTVLAHASGVYDEMLTYRVQNDRKNTLTQAQKLLTNYPSTPYAEIAALMLAHNAIANKNYPEAITQLTWTLQHSHQASIRQIARLRIARIYIAQQNPAEAIKTLQKVNDKTFNGLINEVLGDAYLAMHRIPEALAAYQQALKDLPNSEEIRPLLEMKVDNLARS